MIFPQKLDYELALCSHTRKATFSSLRNGFLSMVSTYSSQECFSSFSQSSLLSSSFLYFSRFPLKSLFHHHPFSSPQATSLSLFFPSKNVILRAGIEWSVGPPTLCHLHTAFNAACKWLLKRRSPLQGDDRLLACQEVIISCKGVIAFWACPALG